MQHCVSVAPTCRSAGMLCGVLPQRFRPITVEKPKVLLPLVNVPLLEYTLEWLALNKVEEVRFFCVSCLVLQQ
jgi:translation initiation factor eIF-2B subunit epsilon